RDNAPSPRSSRWGVSATLRKNSAAAKASSMTKPPADRGRTRGHSTWNRLPVGSAFALWFRALVGEAADHDAVPALLGSPPPICRDNAPSPRSSRWGVSATLRKNSAAAKASSMTKPPADRGRIRVNSTWNRLQVGSAFALWFRALVGEVADHDAVPALLVVHPRAARLPLRRVRLRSDE